eukprot:TRINITY_DN1796_c0_g2_i5.p1 TRINITY_DN1796_c0_g2~~TRINITY_DN1796_c0_g2_i5.p1  ORF type:complete len:242 (+),score=56.20 TRINITY_DN1796_c0_g2_i5:458-1183(+)
MPLSFPNASIKSRNTITPSTSSSITKELFSRWNDAGEQEVRFSLLEHLCTSIRWEHDNLKDHSSINCASLYKHPNVFCGVNWNIDTKFPSIYHRYLEGMIGVTPDSDKMGYLKYQMKNLSNLGKLSLGLYMATCFKFPWLKKNEDEIIEKKYEGRLEGAMEASYDFSAMNRLTARIAGRFRTKKRVAVQAALDSDLKLSSVLTYHPTKGLDFKLFNDIEMKKIMKKNEDFHTYGFAVELTC